MKVLTIRLHDRPILRAQITEGVTAVDLVSGMPFSLNSSIPCLLSAQHVEVLAAAGSLQLTIGAGAMQELEIAPSNDVPSGVEIIDEVGNRHDAHERAIVDLLSPQQKAWLDG